MVDDFVVCVDRIIASACFQPVNNGERGATSVRLEATDRKECDVSLKVKSNGEEGCSSLEKFGEMMECRICQEEDVLHALESPCACNGTLKFAHRRCIQRWCNKKGDITCEICKQVFSPNYSLPPARRNPDVTTIDIRQTWDHHINLRDSHLLALAAAERPLLQSDYDDYAVANTTSISCLRSVALILLIVLLLRQVLLVTRDSGMVQESSSFFHVSVLQFAGFLLPFYVMARSWYMVLSRRRQRDMV